MVFLLSTVVVGGSLPFPLSTSKSMSGSASDFYSSLPLRERTTSSLQLVSNDLSTIFQTQTKELTSWGHRNKLTNNFQWLGWKIGHPVSQQITRTTTKEYKLRHWIPGATLKVTWPACVGTGGIFLDDDENRQWLYKKTKRHGKNRNG